VAGKIKIAYQLKTVAYTSERSPFSVHTNTAKRKVTPLRWSTDVTKEIGVNRPITN